jgi:hypothetical protein
MVTMLNLIDDSGELAAVPAVHSGAEYCGNLVGGEPPQAEFTTFILMWSRRFLPTGRSTIQTDRERPGYYYGRGTHDDKYMAATFVSNLIRYKQEGFRPDRDSQISWVRLAAAKQEPSDAVAIVSYDEKPGIQAIANTAPDLPPEPGVQATFARDHEYKRYGPVSLLAGIDLLTGQVHALVKDRHRSREFIEFLKLVDAAYSTHTAIKLILDNHSAHISKETKAWLAEQPVSRFEFIFTPKHGSSGRPMPQRAMRPRSARGLAKPATSRPGTSRSSTTGWRANSIACRR